MLNNKRSNPPSSSGSMLPPTKKLKTPTSAASSSSDVVGSSTFNLKQHFQLVKKHIDLCIQQYEKNADIKDLLVQLNEFIITLNENLSTQMDLLINFIKDLNGLQIFIKIIEYDYIFSAELDLYLNIFRLFKEITQEEANPEEYNQYIVFMDTLSQDEYFVSLFIDFILKYLKDEDFINEIFPFLENMVEYDDEILKFVSKDNIKLLLDFLFNNLNNNESYSSYTQLYFYEILFLLISTSNTNIETTLLENKEYMDKILILLNEFRSIKNDTNMEVDEMVENLFNILGGILIKNEKFKEYFNEFEGIELMIAIIKDKKKYRLGSIKVLNNSMSNSQSNISQFVQNGGLKTLFALFSRLKDSDDDVMETNLINIFVNLLSSKEDLSQRLAVKFEENQFEKLKILNQLLYKYYKKIYIFDQQIENEDLLQEMFPDQTLEEITEQDIALKRLDIGLEVLQRLCFVLAHLCSSSDKVKHFAKENLSEKYKISLETCKVLLQDSILDVPEQLLTNLS